MRRVTGLLTIAAVLAGCASQPELTPWRADALLAGLPPTCSTGVKPAPDSENSDTIVPGGIAVVTSGEAHVVLVAARACVMTVDAASGAVEPLPTRGDSIAPTMVDGRTNGLAFSSSLSGSVRAIDTEGAVTFNVSGLRRPLGVRLMPGGLVLVAEHDAGRILRLGPSDDSRPRLMAEKLDGPTGIVIVDATRGYVTESRAGRVTAFRLDNFETTVVAKGLQQPEGIALLSNGHLAVAEVGKRRLVDIDPKTGDIAVMADNLPIGLPVESDDGSYTVTDVASGPDGALYVSSDVDRTILRVLRRPPAPTF
jgi:glucose/arabinose dehydrogenase